MITEMKKLTLTLGIVLLLACSSSCFAKKTSVKGVKHVVLIGLDGLGGLQCPQS